MDRNKVIVIGVLILLIGAVAAMKYSEMPQTAPAPEPQTQAQPQTKPAGDGAKPSTLPPAGGLQKTDLKVGTGKAAKTGDHVTVHYIGTLTNGTKFDASRDHGQPFEFDLGAGGVIKGWDEGVVGMKEGGKRKLVIPGDLAYGADPPPNSPITPNATLVFEIELLKVG